MDIFYLSLESIKKEGFLTPLFQSLKGDNLGQMQQSLETDGLLNPIVVVKTGDTFEVVDGQKRLRAIRALSKSNRYRRRFSKIPCILAEQCPVADDIKARRPILLNDQELVSNIIRASRSTRSLSDISKRYECDLSIAMQCLSLKNINREIFKMFNKGRISLEQAAAFSVLNDRNNNPNCFSA